MTLSKKLQISFSLFAVAATAVAEAHGGQAAAPTHRPTPEEIAAFDAAKPAFERHCFRCHTTGGKKSKRKALDHVLMDNYPFGGHHADEVGSVVRKVLGGAGNGKATMPSDDPGAVRGDDLAKIVAWSGAFDRARAKPAKRDELSPTRGRNGNGEASPPLSGSESTSGAPAPVLYTCPMHPEVTSSEPGRCPKCGMKLVPKAPAAVPKGAKKVEK